MSQGPQQAPPPTPRPAAAIPLVSMNPQQPGTSAAQQPSQQMSTGQTQPNLQTPPAQQAQAGAASSWQLPKWLKNNRLWHLVGWFLGFALTAGSFWALSPSYKSVDLGKISNRFSEQSVKLAEWDAWLSFKQDCEARLHDDLPASADCDQAISTIIRAPPYPFRLVKRSVDFLAKRSADVTQSFEGAFEAVIILLGLSTLFYVLWSTWRIAGKSLKADTTSLLRRLALWIVACFQVLLVWTGIARLWSWTRYKLHVSETASVEGRQMDPLGYRELQEFAAMTDPSDPRISTLLEAAAAGNTAMAKFFCDELGVDLNIRDAYLDRTALMICMVYNHIRHPLRTRLRECARILLTHGTNPDAVDAEGMTAIMHAARRGLAEETQLLISAGAKLDQCIPVGNITALHLACEEPLDPVARGFWLEEKMEIPGVIHILVQAGANVNAADRDGRTALHRAMSSEPPLKETITTLLSLNTDMSLINNKGRVPCLPDGYSPIMMSENPYESFFSGIEKKRSLGEIQNSSSTFLRERHAANAE